MDNQIVSVPASQIVEADESFSLRLTRSPEAIVKEARLCSDSLMAAVRRNAWAQKFGAREHLFFEAWAFLATMYRVTARIRETRLVQIGDVTGYEAYAEAYHVPTGQVISTAESMCLDDEENWGSRPSYEWRKAVGKSEKIQTGERKVPLAQLRSMAQTRAMSRALKAPFSWIVAMAGYAPTPAEEMGPDEMPERQERQEVRQPIQRQSMASSPPRTISEKQASRIWGIGHGAGKSKEDITAIMQRYGFAQAADVTLEKYDLICEELGKGDA